MGGKSSFTVPFELKYSEIGSDKISLGYIEKYIPKDKLSKIKNVFYIDDSGISWVFKRNKRTVRVPNGTEIQVISTKEDVPDEFIENVAIIDFVSFSWYFDENLIKSYKPESGKNYIVIVPKYSSYSEVMWMMVDISYTVGKRLDLNCIGNNTYYIDCDKRTAEILGKYKKSIESNYKVLLNIIKDYKNRVKRLSYEW